MFPDEGSRLRHDRLAALLADARGGEILAELIKVQVLAQDDVVRNTGDLGVWTVRDGALHRRSGPDCDTTIWADVEHVPPAGDARRVVLLGESTARGWPYDPAFNCAMALARNLSAAGRGPYQVVDLAKTRARAADLVELADGLPALRPDVVVAFAGNNICVPPGPIDPTELLEDLEVQDTLARAVRGGGYTGMSAALAGVAQARCRRFLDRLAALADGGAQIVLVVPEFNLAGWVPQPGVETPLLPGDALMSWYGLAAEAEHAVTCERWEEVGRLVEAMTRLDGGTSPVSGYLAGTAARHLGDAAAARRALESSRDAVCGLLVSCAPRTTRQLQELMLDHATDRGWRSVDLRAVLADPECLGLPGEQWFHDYCHLTDTGIELAMAAVADAVLGLPSGSTPPGPGVPATDRAFARAHAGVHLAYTGQPPSVVLGHLHAAVKGDPELVAPLTAVRDLLSGPTPRWTNPAARELLGWPAVRSFLAALVQTDGLPDGLWTLRDCLGEVLGPETTLDGDDETDLLLGPHCGGHALPNYTPARCHHQATARLSRLPFALTRPGPATVVLTYRMPWAPAGTAAEVLVNGAVLGSPPSSRRWRDATLQLSPSVARAGVNELVVRWPIPYEDVHARYAEDAAALARGQFPYVLPLFGELFTARIHPEGEHSDGRSDP